MSTKVTLLSLTALVVGLLLGRFSLPAKIITKTETVEVDKKQSSINSNKQDHSIVTVTQTKKPDGSITTVTQTQKNVAVVTDTKSKETDDKDTKTSKETDYNTSKWTLSALVIDQVGKAPVYGGSVSFKVLGPFSIGILGASNGMFGTSIGITF